MHRKNKQVIIKKKKLSNNFPNNELLACLTCTELNIINKLHRVKVQRIHENQFRISYELTSFLFSSSLIICYLNYYNSSGEPMISISMELNWKFAPNSLRGLNSRIHLSSSYILRYLLKNNKKVAPISFLNIVFP